MGVGNLWGEKKNKIGFIFWRNETLVAHTLIVGECHKKELTSQQLALAHLEREVE